MVKKLIFILCTVILVISFVSCNSKEISVLKNEILQHENVINDNLSRIKQLEEDLKERDTEINRLKSEKDKEIYTLMSDKNSEINMLKAEISKRTITFDDQKQVEKLIRDYFTAIERKDYASAWELTSPERKKEYTKEMALKEHWGIESLKFISIEGYLPPIISKTIEVPPNTPTVWFGATFEIEPSPNSSWTPWKGKTGRYVDAVKGTDGIWRINALNTGF